MKYQTYNIKQIYSIVLIVAIFVITSGIFQYVIAVEKTASPSSAVATPSASITPLDKEVKNIKDGAAKVAKLLGKDQKAITGKVMNNNGNVLRIKGIDEIEYDVKIDEVLTKMYTIGGDGKKQVKIGDFKKDAYVIVTGPVIGKAINANYIYQDEQFLLKSGKITEINKTDFYIKVLTNDKDTFVLDIESSTKQQIINFKTLDIEKIGFAKMKEGDTIHFVIKTATRKKENNRYPVQKFLIIPQEYFMK